MAFEFTYTVKAGDNLTSIAKAWGFANPGPLFAHPGNKPLFQRRTANQLRPGDQLVVPYHPDALRKIAATADALALDLARSATKLIADQRASQNDLEAFLIKIDAANFLASLGVGMGSLVAQGLRGSEMTAKEALVWLAEHHAGVASNVTTLVIPAPQAPRRDFKFYVRHALGPWNPSFWTSVAVAIKEKDLDTYLYGPAATTHRMATKIKSQADADIARLKERAQQARLQLAMPYYNQRI